MSIIQIAVSSALMVSLGAAQGNHGEQADWWSNDTVIADADNLCNTKASTNVYAQYDAKAWREEFRTNCWWPVFEGKSRYFIKTYDWGAAPPIPLVAVPGYSPSYIEVWVNGLHRGDASVSFRRSLTLYRFTCVRGTKRIAAVQFVAYDAHGRVVEEWERPKVNSRAVIPGSKEDAFATAVCS